MICVWFKVRLVFHFFSIHSRVGRGDGRWLCVVARRRRRRRRGGAKERRERRSEQGRVGERGVKTKKV